MRVRVRCLECWATAWTSGSYESDTNATNIDDENLQWEPDCMPCSHEEYEVIDEDYHDDHFPDDVM